MKLFSTFFWLDLVLFHCLIQLAVSMKTATVSVVDSALSQPIVVDLSHCVLSYINHTNLLPSDWLISYNIVARNESFPQVQGTQVYEMAREIKKNGNVMAIIGPKQSIHMQTFQFLVATKQVPHILPFALDPALKADRFPWLVQTTRTYDDQVSGTDR